MARVTRSNVPADALRWSPERAAHEFGLTTNTLRKALNKNSAVPDKDGCYTTAQIVGALYGALHQEKLRTQREIADRYTLENQITRAEVLDRAELMRGLSLISDAMASRIQAAGIDRALKEDLLKNLSSLPLVLQDIAHAQSRLPHTGKHHNGDVSED